MFIGTPYTSSQHHIDFIYLNINKNLVKENIVFVLSQLRCLHRYLKDATDYSMFI